MTRSKPSPLLTHGLEYRHVNSVPSGKSFLDAIANAKAGRGTPQAAPVQETAPEPTKPEEVPAQKPEESPMQRALREARAKVKATQPTVLAEPPVVQPAVPALRAVPDLPYADVPDVGESQLSPDEQMLDRVIEGIDLVEAYNRWCGKMQVNPGGKKESIKCSCPDPAHPDKNPSAWMNRDKGTGYCSGCDTGFDLWDIAAWRFGYPVPGYKTDKKMFRDLRDSIATDLGYAKYTTAGKTRYEKAEGNEENHVEEAAGAQELVGEEAVEDAGSVRGNVVQLFPGAEPSPELPAASFDWRLITPEGTFLYEWMTETTKDTCPEEFHLFSGLMAIGAAVGRNRVLRDIPDVVPNLNVCLVGKSGTGKSRAKRHLKTILHAALPFDPDIPFPTGVKTMMPGSGEALVKSFIYMQEDPINPQAPKQDWPIRGFVEFDEMATLVAKGARVGSSLKTQLMELYDAPDSMGNETITGGSLVARRPFGLVMTTTQNKSIQGVLDSKDDAAGFINRWVFVTGPAKPPVAINTLHLDFGPAIKKLKAIHHWANSEKKLDFSPDALAAFTEFILKTVIPARDRAEDENDLMNRIDLLLKKIVVLLACNDRKDEVDLDVVERMTKIYPYLCQAYGIIEDNMGRTVGGEWVDAILLAMSTFRKKKNRNPTANDIRMFITKSKRDPDQIARTMDLMVRGGLLEKEVFKPERGRSSVRFFAV